MTEIQENALLPYLKLHADFGEPSRSRDFVSREATRFFASFTASREILPFDSWFSGF
jgi:hypothetical protein